MVDLPGAISDIEASLVATLRREEESTANDLARSFVNDLDLTRAVRGLAMTELLLVDGGVAAVLEVGADHFLGEGRNPACVPFSYATLRGRLAKPAEKWPDEDPPPSVSSDVTLLERLREWADRGVSVRVTTGPGTAQEGTLVRATPDHLAVQRMGREICVAWAVVREVKALEEIQPLSLEDRG